MDKKKIRDELRLIGAIIFFWIYIPHLLVGLCTSKRRFILSDVGCKLQYLKIKIGPKLALLYLLHNDIYFRKLFYFRIGPIWTLLIGWYLPGTKLLRFSGYTTIGMRCNLIHPSTTSIVGHIGDDFYCLQNVTIGKKNGKMPTIGNHVTVYASALIFGDVKIGNNVIIGAGSVVTKDIPDNSVAVGNPAHVIKTLSPQ